MTWIILAIVAILIIAIIAMYNGLVSARIKVDNAWSQIDVQLQRRFDLIPNLVETVRGAAAHEKDTLSAVIAARNTAMSARGVDDKSNAEMGLSGALNKLFALGEAYPTLRAITFATTSPSSACCLLPSWPSSLASSTGATSGS